MPVSAIHIAFPLLALLLVYIASLGWSRYVGPPFFLAIATPILIALAVIRMLAYALRRLFPSQSWLPASELAIGTAIWGLALLYFLGVLPEIARTLESVEVPLGKTQLNLLLIFQAAATVALALVLTLSLSGLFERRLSRATQLS